MLQEFRIGRLRRFTGGWELARLNKLSGPNMLQVAMCLKLPGRKAGTRTPSQPVRACTGCVVKKFDRKLGDVAVAALGDRGSWPEIAKLNGPTAEKPHRLGQCLELPE